MAWLAEEPKLMDLNNEGLANAYLGADADYLPCAHGIPCPAWASTAERVKKTSWSAAKSPNLKATLVQESPAAFRVRNLFVSANALHRA